MGLRVAHSFAAPGVLDYLDVGPEDELIVAGLDEHLERFPAGKRQSRMP